MWYFSEIVFIGLKISISKWIHIQNCENGLVERADDMFKVEATRLSNNCINLFSTSRHV